MKKSRSRTTQDLDIRKSGEIYFNGKRVPETLHNRGYMKIWVNGTNEFVHRLVAMKFVSNPFNKPCVNHINGDKTDNRAVNLEWVTYQENMDHAKKNNLLKYKKYDADFIKHIKSLRGKYPYKEIAVRYNMPYASVKYLMYK